MASNLNSICAFDIGIKNLSYCILTRSNSKNSIINWELIDLRTTQPTCSSIMTDGTICGKPAKLCHKTNKALLFCAKHSANYKPECCSIIKSKIPKPCEFSPKKCSKTGCNLLDNKTYCDVHVSKIHANLLKENKLCKLKIVGCMKEPLYDIGQHMYDALNKRPEILKTEKIVIENQPSLTNPTMKSISVLLLSYFIMNKHPCVEFIAPSGKLKVNEVLTKQILGKCASKPIKYAITKELGINYCEELLKLFDANANWHEQLQSSKKKDDLCDAFLHAYYHMYGAVGLKSPAFIEQVTSFFDNKIKLKATKKNKLKKETLVLEL